MKNKEIETPSLEYKRFWLSVRPLYGELRYACEIVNIENYDYKYNESKGFNLGHFYARTESEVQTEFHKIVDFFIYRDFRPIEYDEAIINAEKELYNKIIKDLKHSNQ